ncbi:uncharacterized protein PAC_06287 [Phialocephala subalpina]|uniref:ER transporter 6TM N-terminal domain-containing protein n=1 Tax=Phialocephala subalpina TaxID=576137 RepID=A0A1L7WUG8_9HELO|nr:uncharacterized protein PAC_06287 [Phialocephala subalpina]
MERQRSIDSSTSILEAWTHNPWLKEKPSMQMFACGVLALGSAAALGSVPVAVSLGFYQATSVSEVYTSLGFLVSIIAVVTVNLLPRAKLIQMTFTICLFTAVAIPITMLATWSGLQARFHTDPEGLNKYNSSQSAITGIWLFCNILVSNGLQARYPHLLIPTILYNIFVIVQLTSCSRFTTWTKCWDLIYLTVRCYYTGVAISFVSGMLIYPVTCRSEIFEVQEQFIEAVRGMLGETVIYLGKLQTTPTFADDMDCKENSESESRQVGCNDVEMRQRMAGVKAIYIKMHSELAMAKNEIAWGKLRARDINAFTDLSRRILMPLGGMANLPDILKRIGHDGGWVPSDFESMAKFEDKTPHKSQEYGQDVYETVWKECIGALIEPASSVIQAMQDGLEHAGLQLEIIPRPGTKNFLNWMPGAKRTKETDREAEGQTLRPGDPNFAKLLEDKLFEFSQGRAEALNSWAESKGLSEAQLQHLQALPEFDTNEDSTEGHVRRDRQQLYLILYIQHMLYTTGIAVIELSKFSDVIVAQGIMSRNRLIVPSFRRLGKWFLSVFDTADAVLADDDRPSSKQETRLIYGTANRTTRNIEHLPPRNAYERFGIRVRRFQEFLKGPEFSFGFRSALATMSCAILAYLHQTQEIFTHYRLIWSVIIAAIGANMSAGQSGLSYVLRILGSFAALIICYAVWYIPDGKVPGVIVIMWFASFLQMYFLIRWPKYIIGWLVILITEVLSIGYELQVKKIGVKAAESTGIYVFPPYYVAALRVACVLWGTVASIIFTYLPYPITARSLLRKDMAVVMHLLASYHAVVHSSIKARLRGSEGNVMDKTSRGRVLSHTRKAMFNKMMVLSSSVKHNVYLQKYEPGLGGRFPVAIFTDILSQLAVLLDYMSLLSYSTEVLAVDGPYKEYFHHSSSRKWLEDLSNLIGPMNPTEVRITSILSQLSAAVSTGRALPTRIESIKPYQLSQRLQVMDPEVLHLKHIQELGYSAYAVMEILSSMITKNLDVLVDSIESLVGVVSFDYEDFDDENKAKTL